MKLASGSFLTASQTTGRNMKVKLRITALPSAGIFLSGVVDSALDQRDQRPPLHCLESEKTATAQGTWLCRS